MVLSADHRIVRIAALTAHYGHKEPTRTWFNGRTSRRHALTVHGVVRYVGTEEECQRGLVMPVPKNDRVRQSNALGRMADHALTLERPMRIHQWQVRGPDRSVKEILPETSPNVVGQGILGDSMLYLTARRAEDGVLFRVFVTPEDLRRLVGRAMERDDTAAIVRQAAIGDVP